MLDVTSYALRKYGYEVVGVTDGALALERWQTSQPDLVLLDVNLPHLSGMDICREIRKQSSVPIIMVTAHNDENHVVEGFESGADDYVGKPLSYRALAMRNADHLAASHRRRLSSTRLHHRACAAGISVDLEGHEVLKDGRPARLTRLETRILFHLVSNAGRGLSTNRLVELVWNYDGGDAFALKTHICHIRRKLNLMKGQPGYICSVPHVGYKLETAHSA